MIANITAPTTTTTTVITVTPDNNSSNNEDPIHNLTTQHHKRIEALQGTSYNEDKIITYGDEIAVKNSGIIRISLFNPNGITADRMKALCQERNELTDRHPMFQQSK